MSRAAFRKADLERMIAALKAAGCEIALAEYGKDGTLRVVTKDGKALTRHGNGERNEWDYT